MKENGAVRIEHVSTDGTVTVMKEEVKLLAGEVIDSSRMQIKELCKFFEEEIQDAHDNQLLLSLHLKATMMKVSDPIMFGHCVKTFFKDAIEKHESTLQRIGFNANNGLGDLFEKIETLPAAERKAIERDINECYKERPWLAMVDSSKGITNLHVPSDVIVDASMPVVVRDSGKMWNKDDELEDTKCLIPDRCYATFYQEVMSFVKSQGQFDVTTMGNVANVGLMAQKAEEYGSHDKTFEVAGDGTMRVVDAASGVTVFEHSVETGDIWRMCQTKDVAIKDWVKLAVSRARATGDATTFWLDKERAHDRSIIAKVEEYMKDHDTAGLKIDIKAPVDAVRETMARAVKGENSISVTGNVLRDYLTDLFPIIELGTSAKMLSIVPLLNGGGMFETGAGGSAPKHVQQFVKEGHLRWDSLGEYLALAVSLEHLGQQGNDKAMKLGQALNQAIGRLLTNRKSPSRKVNELDNRASNFYVGLYWAEFMAEMDPSYKALATELMERRTDIVEEFKKSQGEEVDVGGYYMYDDAKAALAMQPSSILNSILEKE
jgi:isocitrate dehydrogenase